MPPIKSTQPTTITLSSGPPYVATFAGVPHRINSNGHIFLNNDTPPLELTFKLLQRGFRFSSKAAGDAKDPMFTGIDATHVNNFNLFGGVFKDPDLKSNNTVFSFIVGKADHKIYYYLLNLIGPHNHPFSIDPIIVNK
jgi:hypothetical protein